MVQLPAVASSFYCHCSKCGLDRYHRVLTHTNETTVRLKCEVCGKTGNHNLEVKKASASKSKTTRPASARSISAKAAAHASEFEAFKSGVDTGRALAYNMKITFKEDQVVQHPKFGIGLVRSVQGDKIEVFFEDEVRFLVHGRG
jgi:uncharacterized Zn finger protein